MTDATATAINPAERFVGELYRNDSGAEVWRINEVATGRVVNADISSDSDYLWLLDHRNHGCDYADLREAERDAARMGLSR